MTRTALLTVASLFLSTSAFAWSVPLIDSGVTVEPGLHDAGDPIPCTVDNGWGQTFQGTVTTVDGELHCSGLAAPADDEEIDAAVRERTSDAYAEFSEDGEEVEIVIVALEGGDDDIDWSRALGGSDPLKKLSGI